MPLFSIGLCRSLLQIRNKSGPIDPWGTCSILTKRISKDNYKKYVSDL